MDDLDNTNRTFELRNLIRGNYTLKLTDCKGNNKEQAIAITVPDDVTAAITISFEKIDVACHGESTGKITITPAGGKSPYTMDLFKKADSSLVESISTSPFTFSTLPAGNYFPKITDAAECNKTFYDSIIVISQPDALAIETIEEASFTSDQN